MKKSNRTRNVLLAAALALGFTVAPMLSASATPASISGDMQPLGQLVQYTSPHFHTVSGSINFLPSYIPCGGVMALGLRGSNGNQFTDSPQWSNYYTRTFTNVATSSSVIPVTTFYVNGRLTSYACFGTTTVFSGTLNY